MDWAITVMERLGYFGLAFVVALESIFPPIPSEVILPFAGFLTASGVFTLAGALAAATVGSIIGAFALYWIGYLLGRKRFYDIVRRYGRYFTVTEDQVAQAEAWFHRRGGWAVFLCRMVPVLRSLISVPAGLARMSLARYVLYTAMGSLIWNLALVGLGAALGSAWPKVTLFIGYYQHLVLALILLVAVAWLARLWLVQARR